MPHIHSLYLNLWSHIYFLQHYYSISSFSTFLDRAPDCFLLLRPEERLPHHHQQLSIPSFLDRSGLTPESCLPRPVLPLAIVSYLVTFSSGISRLPAPRKWLYRVTATIRSTCLSRSRLLFNGCARCAIPDHTGTSSSANTANSRPVALARTKSSTTVTAFRSIAFFKPIALAQAPPLSQKQIHSATTTKLLLTSNYLACGKERKSHGVLSLDEREARRLN